MKILKYRIAIFCCLTFSIFFTTNMANANSSYIKFNYGVTSNSLSTTSKTGTVIEDSDDEGFMIAGGALIGDVWGVDVMYYDLGSTSIKADANEIFEFGGTTYQANSSGTISNDITGYGIGVFLSSSTSEDFLSISGNLRLGLHAWDKSGSTTILDNDAAFSGDFYNDGIGPYLGLGLTINILENTGIDLSYDNISLSNNPSFDENSSIVSLGIKYNF